MCIKNGRLNSRLNDLQYRSTGDLLFYIISDRSADTWVEFENNVQNHVSEYLSIVLTEDNFAST